MRRIPEKAGLWESLKPKLVQAESMPQALQYVQTGNAETGLVAHSVAEVPEVKAIEVDSKLYDPILQGLGVVSKSAQIEFGRKFAQFVLGEECQG